MPLMSWQLWLARESVEDNPLPWQKPQTDLTPGRVAQGFSAILAAIHSPAVAPKPRGKSPGWPLSSAAPEENSLPSGQKDYTKTETISETAESKASLKPDTI